MLACMHWFVGPPKLLKATHLVLECDHSTYELPQTPELLYFMLENQKSKMSTPVILLYEELNLKTFG